MRGRHARAYHQGGRGPLHRRTLGGWTVTTFAATDLSDADGCFVAYAAHELRG